jgi:hypothetical protein
MICHLPSLCLSIEEILHLSNGNARTESISGLLPILLTDLAVGGNSRSPSCTSGGNL